MACAHEYEQNHDGSQSCKFCPRVQKYDERIRDFIVIQEGD